MTPDPIVYSQFGPVAEGGSFLYSGVLTEEDAVTPVPGNSISALSLTLTDLASQEVINSRDGQDVLNDNQCTFDAAGATGLFTWAALPADNPFVRVDPPPAEADVEVHQAILTWHYFNGSSQPMVGRRKIFIVVEKYLGADVLPGGSGAHSYADAVYEPGGTDPLEGAEVWVTSDSAGEAVVAGPQLTDCDGAFAFRLAAAGSYYLWVKADGFTFGANPIQITVT